MEAALKVVRYIKGSASLGLIMPSNKENDLVAYCDLDRGVSVETRRPITGYITKHFDIHCHFVREKILRV